jgi:hypothetical protein
MKLSNYRKPSHGGKIIVYGVADMPIHNPTIASRRHGHYTRFVVNTDTYYPAKRYNVLQKIRTASFPILCKLLFIKFLTSGGIRHAVDSQS